MVVDVAVPNWPAVPYESLKDGFSIDPMLPPIETEMEGGNKRIRARPGDNVSIVQQAVPMLKTEYDTLVAWGKTTIGNWTGRFSMSVFLGSAYATKVCQFEGGAPKPVEYTPDQVAVTMKLRVYGV